MPLDPDEVVSLSLAGTVALPSPFPASGTVDIIVQGAGRDADGTFLRVTHRVNRRLKIARIVALEHVRVVLAERSLAPERHPSARTEEEAGEEGQWVATTLHPLRERVRQQIRIAEERQRESKDPDDPLDPVRLVDEAILYVPEWAPVLMQVEVSMTAAESANYYPPMAAREPHQFLCDDRKKRCDN